MGKLFTLSDDIKKIAQDGIDDLIDQLGKDCRLLYPSVQEDCPNCIYDPIANRSTGRYQTGGPQPFPQGTICPVCRGVGKLVSDTSEIIRMLCQWNPKNYELLAGNIQVPNSVVQTKGYLSDMPKVLKARKMVLETSIEGYQRYTFELWGEPIDQGNIIQGRYFVALWRRVAG